MGTDNQIYFRMLQQLEQHQQCPQSQVQSFLYKQEIIQILELFSSLLINEPRNMMALQSLGIMTDPHQVGIKVVLFSSRVDLFGTNNLRSNTSSLTEIVLSVAFGYRKSCARMRDHEDGGDVTSPKSMEYFALNVLLNAMEVVTTLQDYDNNWNNYDADQDSILLSFLERSKKEYQIEVIEELISILDGCGNSYSLHEAYLAVRIMSCLCSSSRTVLEGVFRCWTNCSDNFIHEVFDDTKCIGRSHHLLRREWNRLLNVVRC